jgi:hypothetical protein
VAADCLSLHVIQALHSPSVLKSLPSPPFTDPAVLSEAELPAIKWTAPDEEGILQFLVTEKSFNEERVRKAIEKIKDSKGKATQGRLESFFGPVTVKPAAGAAAAAKRKVCGLERGL